jgi:hypothetical protein
LKQLQLIQILSINPERPAAADDVAAKDAGINRAGARQNASKAVSGHADTALECWKQGFWSVRRFTAR